MQTNQYTDLIEILKARFENHQSRHEGLSWATVRERLETRTEKLRILHNMETTGGEPDVIGYDKAAGTCTFADCAKESPEGRRNLCYDRAALNARKAHKPAGSAEEAAAAMGIELLTEDQYRTLQPLGSFDTKTSSWIRTPAAIRTLGGALFPDRRYGTVFIYHNGAQSYYSSRGFRGLLYV